MWAAAECGIKASRGRTRRERKRKSRDGRALLVNRRLMAAEMKWRCSHVGIKVDDLYVDRTVSASQRLSAHWFS